MTGFSAPDGDVVISSRVRLARNYMDIPFSPMMDEELAALSIDRAKSAILNGSDEYELIMMADISFDERTELVEHHLVSYDLLKFADYSAALISSGKTISVMVNEEDHLRIQGLLPGMQLPLASELAFSMDERLNSDHPFAYDSKWGYLTSCPTNTGTGMRASVMLHLPALTAAGQLPALLQTISKLGLTVRGLYGEGSDAMGNLYQLSNQVTLGRTEEDMIKTLMVATSEISDHERALRETVRVDKSMLMLDKLMRSVGIMGHARVMTSQEFMKRYSDLRLLAAMDIIEANLLEIDRIMMDLQPSTLNVNAGAELTDQQQAIVRAELLRVFIKTIAS